MSAFTVSRRGLPLSQVSAWARRCRFASITSAIFSRMFERCAAEVRPQASFAAWAASRAASMSSGPERATSQTFAPVIGVMLSM